MKKILIMLLIAIILISATMLFSCGGHHVHTEVVIAAVESTCYSYGWTEGVKCSTCYEILVEPERIDLIPHIEVVVPGVEPTTCDWMDGLTEGKKCSVCNEWIVCQEPISLPHTEETIPAVEATCNTYGKSEGVKCSVCGQTLVWPETIYEYGDHNEVIDEAVAPTCTDTGLSEGKHCDVCNTVLVGQDIIPSLGHTYEKWTIDRRPSTLEEGLRHSECSVCGEDISVTYTFSEGLQFVLKSDGESYYVYSIGTCEDTEVVIPNFYKNLPVTAIGDGAFKNCENITYVEIPYSITSIGNSAFYGCKSLENIEIPYTVTSIGNSTFYNCDSLTYMLIPNSVVTIDYYAFDNCDSLENIEFDNNSNLITIGTRAFRNCKSLTDIVIPEGVISIGSEAFWGCTSLENIFIPESVSTIGADAIRIGISDSLVIYCEAESQPDGWHKDWNRDYYGFYYTIVWGYTGE